MLFSKWKESVNISQAITKQSIQVFFTAIFFYKLIENFVGKKPENQETTSFIRNEHIFSDDFKASTATTNDLGEAQCCPSGTVELDSWVTMNLCDSDVRFIRKGESLMMV